MAVSPATDDGVVKLSVYSGGQAIPATAQLMSLAISRAVNTIPAAQLVLQDGDMATGEWEISDAALFNPGADIRIALGYGDTEKTVFEGVVIRHGLKITGENNARLVVECRDKAMRMTVGRRNAHHIDQTDSDILRKLIGAAGLSADVQSTTVQHRELVQHYCTDWDFMLTRAEANGLLVIATDGRVSVKAPKFDAAPALEVNYGVDLMEFHADIDARTQWAKVQAFSWDMKTQAALDGGTAGPSSTNAQGDMPSGTLAQVAALDVFRLQSAAPLTAPELKLWAEAQQLKAGLARVRGRMRFQGHADARVGELIGVQGVGKKFSGKAFIGAVRHEVAAGNWITEVEFGLPPDWFSERPDVVAPAAGGLLPAVHGLQIGVVSKLDGDPDQEHKIQVTVPVAGAANPGVWARLLQLHASNTFGSFFVPEIGDEVVLAHVDGDPSHPVILGGVYSSKHPPPYALEAENPIKAFVTRCQSRVVFDDKDAVITITTPQHNQIVLSDKDKSIRLEDQNGNKLSLSESGISAESPKNIQLKAQGDIHVEAGGAITLSAQADVKCSGLNVACEAQVGFTAKGAASAELSASGETVVKGAIVMIN